MRRWIKLIDVLTVCNLKGATLNMGKQQTWLCLNVAKSANTAPLKLTHLHFKLCNVELCETEVQNKFFGHQLKTLVPE